MLVSNIRIAIHSLRSTRGRSLLTTLGVVIGVASVVLAINIGLGVKKQVTGQIDAAGGNLITVRSGRVVSRDADGKIISYSLNQALSAATLTDQDLTAIKGLDSAALTAPLAEISATTTSINGTPLLSGHVIGTTEAAPDLFGKDVVFGSMFSESGSKTTAVIGTAVAEDLYGDPSPIGRIIKINNQDFVIRGVFDLFQTSPVTIGTDLNRTVFIPYESLDKVTSNAVPIREILVRASSPGEVESTISEITSQVSTLHGQEDFSVLRRSDLQFIADDVFNLVTSLVAAVATISLVVGGIGIMNIMLVSVAERTREIGVRKAIGASDIHIMSQFLTESIVLSVAGGMIGVVVAQIAGLIIRATTSIKPLFDIQVVLVAVAMSIGIGVVFGVGPAYKAARKKPIESLRS